MKETIAKFTSNSYLSVGLVITITGAAVTSGIMFNKVAVLETQVSELKTDVKAVVSRLETKIEKVDEKLSDITDSLAEVRVFLQTNRDITLKK